MNRESLQNLTDSELVELYKATETEIATNDNLQMAMKILLNSGYGALANANFIYFRIENAESITTTGQLVNRWTSERINNLISSITGQSKRYVFYNDTDSAYIEMADVVHEMGLSEETDYGRVADRLDEVLNEIVSPAIQEYTDELCDYLNNYENKMVWEREVISPASINIAKKRYAMLVIDSEGVRYNKPRMKIVGLESKKSSTPKWAKHALEHCYELAVLGKKDEMHKFINEFEQTIFKLIPSEIAIPTGVNGIENYSTSEWRYKLGTPKNVKAAINHNRLIEELELNHIPKIESGSKIKYVELKKPNPIGEDVIGFVGNLPEEFGLEKYVDYKAAYTKGFVKPLQNFLDSIGWETEPVVSLF